MPFDTASLAALIGAGGAPEGHADDPDLAFAEQIARQELGREPDAAAIAAILVGLRVGMSRSDVRLSLRSSYERFVSDNSVAGHSSDAFRRLGAHSSIVGLGASSIDIAECIASYRLLLGREPESAGFETFLSGRRSQTLGFAVRVLAVSGEATEHFAPDDPPSMTIALPAVSMLAVQILHAASSDAAFGTLIRLNHEMRDLSDRMVKMEGRIDRFIEVVLLRLDAETRQ